MASRTYVREESKKVQISQPKRADFKRIHRSEKAVKPHKLCIFRKLIPVATKFSSEIWGLSFPRNCGGE